jgi:hypothetical protein
MQKARTGHRIPLHRLRRREIATPSDCRHDGREWTNGIRKTSGQILTTKPMKRKPKQYPMNGPALHIQALMERPKRNRDELQKWAEHHPTMRTETLAIIPQ